jgi:hypothetical protein
LKHAQLTILSAAAECETIQRAWNAIEGWEQSQPSGTAIELELLERLDRSLVNGEMVISAFEDDLVTWNRNPGNPSFLGRSKIVWEKTLSSSISLGPEGRWRQ